MKINIAHLYPDLLNLYGDRGNIATLKYRLEKRGIEANVTEYGIDDKIDFAKTDIIYIGGGSEKEQKLVCQELLPVKDSLKEFAENGGSILAVCSGYEILGKYYETESEKIPCLEILDIYTKYIGQRLIGNIIIDSELINSTIVGFENHAGKVFAGNHTPLGTVRSGYGGNGEDKKEGVVYKNVIATHMHGPLLPKNPMLADHIIKNALKKKYNEDIELCTLDDTLENQSHTYCIENFS